ncbi:hypothetical protein BRDCF_p22 [Bacteroidales bacterium CF]|jgi:hypothetical protein|nr:hypothetical protein BRDCF_p22 [Bacteroidales bacterium CF]
MEDKNLTQNESLEIISRMIKETRNNMERGGGNIFLLWGYICLIVSLAVYCLLSNTGDYRFNWLWFAIPVVGYPGMIYMLKKREKGAITIVSRVISNIWIVLGIVAGLLSIYMFVDYKAYPIMFVMSLLINSGVAISGLVIRFRPIVIAGFLGILLSFGMLMVAGINQILIFALLAVIMLIIPGHILNNVSRKVKAENNA